MSRRLRSAVVLVFALSIAFSFLSGQQFERVRAEQGKIASLGQVISATQPAASQAEDEAAAQDVSAAELFQEVFGALRSQFVEKIDGPSWERKLGYGAVRGMLAGLADPYTRFMEPEEHQAFQRENEGHFDGIGATITMMQVPATESEKKLSHTIQCSYCGSFLDPDIKHERVAIQAPLPNSPAAKADVRPRDLILAIDGKPTQGMDLGTAVRLIRGKAGTKVALSIGREGAAKPIEKTILRGVIDVPAVETKLPERPGGVGSLTINTFNERTLEMTLEGLKRLRAANAAALVLDLRDCPGGLFSSALQVGRLFVGDGPIVYVQERGRERRPQPSNSSKRGAAFRGPLAVLVNGGTASAAEILAGAVQDYGLGSVIGETTWGKGVVQTVLPLQDGSALVVTTAKYFTPKGRDINKTSDGKGGIVPDQVVKVPKDTVLTYVRLTDQDPQYAEALKILRRKVAAQQAAAAN